MKTQYYLVQDKEAVYCSISSSMAHWVSIILLSSLQKLVKQGMQFTNPDSTSTVERDSDAFVDDAQNGLNDAHLATHHGLLKN
jgi:hypothetical protein